jgi:hypothetical protein
MSSLIRRRFIVATLPVFAVACGAEHGTADTSGQADTVTPGGTDLPGTLLVRAPKVLDKSLNPQLVDSSVVPIDVNVPITLQSGTHCIALRDGFTGRRTCVTVTATQQTVIDLAVVHQNYPARTGFVVGLDDDFGGVSWYGPGLRSLPRG